MKQKSKHTVDICYLECPLSRNFSLVPSAFLVTFLTITFGISNSAISNKFFGPFSSIIPPSRTFSSRSSIFKENSSKTLRFDQMFIFLCSFIIIRTFFLYNRNTMSVKRKLNVKKLNEKCKALRDLESGLSNKEVAAKYGVPKNAVSTWVENKAKLFYCIGTMF